jgi:hypothetical protein
VGGRSLGWDGGRDGSLGESRFCSRGRFGVEAKGSAPKAGIPHEERADRAQGISRGLDVGGQCVCVCVYANEREGGLVESSAQRPTGEWT